jgi:hypothetical protein
VARDSVFGGQGLGLVAMNWLFGGQGSVCGQKLGLVAKDRVWSSKIGCNGQGCGVWWPRSGYLVVKESVFGGLGSSFVAKNWV